MRLTWFVLLLFFLSCNLSSWEKRKLEKNFGTAFNEERKKLGAHPVTGSMRLDENIVGARYIYVNHNQLKVKRPAFIRKVIIVDKAVNEITHEADYYYNPIEQKELDYEFRIARKETVIMLQDAKPGGFWHTDDKGISFQMADSILRAWGIEPPEHL